MTSEQTHQEEVKEQQRQTLVRGLVPVMLFLVGQAGYLIFWMAKLETTLEFALAIQKEIRAELRAGYQDRYTGAQASAEAARINERFQRNEAIVSSLDSRVRTLESEGRRGT